MSTHSPRTNTDTSISFSLAELAKLEEERLREEDARRARTREATLREQREAEARRRAQEAAELAAQEAARAKRAREEAEAKARDEARARAAAEVARIEAEAKARLEADNAARAHELALLRVRTEASRRRTIWALAAALGLAVCGGAASTYSGIRRAAGLEQEIAQLHEGQTALGRERDQARATELATLDRRFTALRARPSIQGAGEARATAEAARSAIDGKAIDHGRMRAFGDALDVLQTRLEALEKLEALDRRHADLAAWAASVRKGEVAAAARSAASKAKLTGADEGSLRAYEDALDKLRDALAQTSGGPRGTVVKPDTGAVGRKCMPGDPGCGLDGKPLF